jgi:hypothetical protein
MSGRGRGTGSTMQRRVLSALSIFLALATPTGFAAQTSVTDQLPFAIGERLNFRAHAARMGVSGRGSMWIQGPVMVRGHNTYVLRFEFRAGLGPVKAVDATESWLDPVAMAVLRFYKHERHPLSNHTERVELFPEDRRWEAEDGRRGESPTDAPLDELSFMYFIRTLPLAADATYRFDRHFEAQRNPASVRVVGRETVKTPAGEFRTILLELRVRDPRRYRGDGLIRINLSDDERRLPVRIESAMPIIGNAVLTLESATDVVQQTLAGAPQRLRSEGVVGTEEERARG